MRSRQPAVRAAPSSAVRTMIRAWSPVRMACLQPFFTHAVMYSPRPAHLSARRYRVAGTLLIGQRTKRRGENVVSCRRATDRVALRPVGARGRIDSTGRVLNCRRWRGTRRPHRFGRNAGPTGRRHGTSMRTARWTRRWRRHGRPPPCQTLGTNNIVKLLARRCIQRTTLLIDLRRLRRLVRKDVAHPRRLPNAQAGHRLEIHLGAIAQRIAAAHEGELHALRSSLGGLRMELKLPLGSS